MKVRILLVEDQQITRSGFKALLESQPELEVVGQTDNGNDAIALTQQLAPDIIIMDIELRGSEMTGIQATRKISTNYKESKVIALSVWEDTAHVKAMLAAGASGYLSKACSPDKLMQAIHVVLDGERYFSRGAERIIQEDYIKLIKNPLSFRQNEISDREMDVLRLTALGDNTKEIASRLNISSKTVDAHRRNVMKKLELNSIADLTKYAIREKIIQEDE